MSLTVVALLVTIWGALMATFVATAVIADALEQRRERREGWRR